MLGRFASAARSQRAQKLAAPKLGAMTAAAADPSCGVPAGAASKRPAARARNPPSTPTTHLLHPRTPTAPQGPLDLSLLFSGHTLHTVTLCLRWLYSPHLATHAALEMERASVLPVFRLAHKLGAEGLLRRVSQYWAGEEESSVCPLWGSCWVRKAGGGGAGMPPMCMYVCMVHVQAMARPGAEAPVRAGREAVLSGLGRRVGC